MEWVLMIGVGLIGWFVYQWVRHDWDTAMKSVPGRMANSAVNGAKTGAGTVEKRDRLKRGLALEDHRAKEATEVIDLEHDRHSKLRGVVVCSKDKGMAYARVRGSLKENAYQIKPLVPVACDLGPGRNHHQFELRKRTA